MATHNSQLQRYIQEILEKIDVKINGDRPWDIQVYNEQFYPRVIKEGSLGLGESYMDKWWDCSQLDQFFAKLLRGKIQHHPINNNLASLWEVAKTKFWNFQSLSRSFQVGECHYDLDNELYQSMLDSRLTYSCGYWKNAKNLDEAQEAKLDLICKKLQLKTGMTLLDIGCGWGSLMKYAAQNYGVSCVGVTVSKEQIQLGEKLSEGLPIKFLLQDYRYLNGQFDRVVSVGMFEHVGYKNYQTFMRVINRCLKEDGLFLLHTIGNNKSVTYGEMWINKYIFPNGMLPSANQITKSSEELFVIEDWHNFGQDYDLTLISWFNNFDSQWSILKSRYGERFYRMWKYYLCSLAGSFRARYIQLWQIVFSKDGILGGYQSVR